MRYLLLTGLFLLSFISHASITIEGVVTNVNGEPVNTCNVYFNKEGFINDESVHVRCDKYGRYKANIEKGLYNSLFICDDEYGKTTLEFWGWNLNLIESQEINAVFDTLEVYSLSTWSSNGGSNSLFASFRPMSLNKAKYKNKLVDDKTIAIMDITPSVTSSSINGFIDSHSIELLNYNWTYEKSSSCKNFPQNIDTSNGCYIPMIIAQFKKPKLIPGQHTLKIKLVDSITGNIGEGITHFVSNKEGLGF